MDRMNRICRSSVSIGIMFLLLTFFAIGCSDSPSETGQEEKKADNDRRMQLSILKPVANCEALFASIKERKILEMEATIDNYLDSALSGSYYCGPVGSIEGDGDIAYPDSAPSETSDGSSAINSASKYSTTNNQVAGVDEADFVENDGNYIYMVTGKTFKIIDAWPAEEAHIITEVEIEGSPKKLFVTENRAMIFSSLNPSDSSPNGNEQYLYYPYADFDCNYGYDCDFMGDGQKLKITLLNIQDKSNPVKLQEFFFSGSYISSRRIGTAVHTVIYFDASRTPNGLSYWPDSLNNCLNPENKPNNETIMGEFENLRSKNRQLIENLPIEEILPSIRNIRYVNADTVIEDNIFSCDNLYESTIKDGQSFVTIASLNMDQTDGLNQTTILGRPGAVYASASAIYIASRQYEQPWYSWLYDENDHIGEASTIHKFKIENNPADCTYVNSSIVKGRVLNQFAMDEYEGCFRIATTTGRSSGPDTHSTLTVLKEENGSLNTTGQVDQIAPEEDIRSVRFDGSRAFMVTFREIDPLFIFDLSDPAKPSITGELKIPGFSTYMHMMDAGHLLTIGYDTNDRTWIQGIMLQIFDISSMSDPILLHKEVLGTCGSSSEAATNHLAFNYFEPKNLLAIPMTLCDSSAGGGNYGGEMTFSGLMVYDVTVESGFSERGRVSHVEPGSEESQYVFSNGWRDSSSDVKRSIIMDDYIFSLTMDEIKIAHLNNLSQVTRVISLSDN